MSRQVDDPWSDLGGRMDDACLALNVLITEAQSDGIESEVRRLKAKLEGVQLVKSYWREYDTGVTR